MDLSALSLLVEWCPYILIFGGFIAISKLASFFVKGLASGVLKGLGYLGALVGFLLLTTGVATLVQPSSSIAIWGLLIVTGLGLSLRPLSRVPVSALLGLFVGLACAGLLHTYFPLPNAVLGISSLWIYLIVFLIPALIVFLTLKFVEDLAKLLGMVLGSWPVLTVLGFLCITQGILMLFNQSLISFFA